MHTPVALILFAVWIIGIFYYDFGPVIHVLPAVAVAILAFRFFQRGRQNSNLKR